jgi:hypothetical protein
LSSEFLLCFLNVSLAGVCDHAPEFGCAPVSPGLHPLRQPQAKLTKR